MKRLLYILFLLALVQNVKAQNPIDIGDTLNHYYLHYDIAFYTELYLTKEPFSYSHTINDSIHTLTIDFTKDSLMPSIITYILKADRNFEPEYLINGAKREHELFLFVSDRTFKIEKEYTVYKFASNPFGIDGCVTHFWVPEIGIILVRSASWGNFRKLRTNDTSIDNLIDLLAELIYQNLKFYRGCTQELELIPTEDIHEFYEWKNKEFMDEYMKKYENGR